MPKTHDATGRTKVGWKSRKRNRPPEGERWVWLTAEMLESPAWRAMTLAARKIVDRLIIEHLAHGGSLFSEKGRSDAVSVGGLFHVRLIK